MMKKLDCGLFNLQTENIYLFGFGDSLAKGFYSQSNFVDKKTLSFSDIAK